MGRDLLSHSPRGCLFDSLQALASQERNVKDLVLPIPTCFEDFFGVSDGLVDQTNLKKKCRAK